MTYTRSDLAVKKNTLDVKTYVRGLHVNIGRTRALICYLWQFRAVGLIVTKSFFQVYSADGGIMNFEAPRLPATASSAC